MNARIATMTGVWVTVAVLGSVLVAKADLLVPISQDRSICANAHMWWDCGYQEASDADSDAAIEFCPFVSSVHALVSEGNVFSEAAASQDSEILADSISVSGAASASGHAACTWDFLDADAGSHFEVAFQLLESANFVLCVEWTASGSSLIEGWLYGPAGYEAYWGNNYNGSGEFANCVDLSLEAGEYTLVVTASAYSIHETDQDYDGAVSYTVNLGPNPPRQDVVLIWDTPIPFQIIPLFGLYFQWPGAMPATTNYPTNDERESFRNDIQQIFSRAGITNVSVTNTPTGGDAALVYLTDWPVDPEWTLPGMAVSGVDRYNLQLAGTAVVFLYDNAIEDSDVLAQEVGHLLGLRHIDPDAAADPNDQSVMDSDFPQGGYLPNFINAITDIFDPFTFHKHNPVYHIRRFVDHVSSGCLAMQGITPGSWDLPSETATGGPINDPITTVVILGGNEIVGSLFDVSVEKGYDPHTQKLLMFLEEITLTELSQIEFIVREGEYFTLCASLLPGGDPDIVLASGDPYNPENIWTVPIDGSMPAQLQQVTRTPPYYQTIEEGVVMGKAGPVDDCNENDFPDYQDIATGLSQDCNNNAIPDECDIADGTSQDANGNGIPDECECDADLDGNGSVGASDLLVLLASWDPCKGCPADFDGSGAVGVSDLLVLLANWGPCP